MYEAAGGDKKFYREGVFVNGAAQGYQMCIRDRYQKPINPYRYGNNYKEQGEKEEQTLTFAALLYRLLRGLSLRLSLIHI